MKYIFLIFISLAIFSRDRGDFVKDIKIKDFEITLPKINIDEIHPNTKMYSIHSDKFPIVYLDLNFYSGENEASKVAVEIPNLLAEVIKLGGSKNLMGEKFSEKLEFLGTRLSFASDFDKFKIEISYLSKDEKVVLDILEDLILNPNFDESILENAKKKAIEVISRRNERTESIGFRKAKELFYRNSRASQIPQIESIKKITLEDLKNFWNLTIKQTRKNILVNGNFNDKILKEKLKKMLPEVLTPLKQDELSLSDLSKDLENFSKKNILVEKKVNQSMIMMVGTLPPHNSKDFYAIQILDYIIGGSGFSSYLMQRIRVAKGLAYSSTSYPIFKKTHGVLYAYTLTKNESLVEVQELMKDILSEKTFSQIKEEEIQTAKTSIINQFVFLFTNDNSTLENELRFIEDSMPSDYLKNYRSELQKVSKEDILRVGKKYFDYSNLKNILISDETTLKKFNKESFIKILPEENIGK